jgi:hypothetical protein
MPAQKPDEECMAIISAMELDLVPYRDGSMRVLRYSDDITQEVVLQTADRLTDLRHAVVRLSKRS